MSGSAIVLIALGSALGGMARHWCALAAVRHLGASFPWGTLGVNILGSFVIGLFGELVGPGGALAGDAAVQEFVMIGLCGGFTTFSSFSLQTLALARAGDWARAAANITLSVAICLAAVWLGWAVAAMTSGT
jgi:CrcB protein